MYSYLSMRSDAEIAVDMALPKDAVHTCLVYPDIDSQPLLMCIDVAVRCANGSEFACILRLNEAYLDTKITFEKEIFRAMLCAYHQHIDYTLKISA